MNAEALRVPARVPLSFDVGDIFDDGNESDASTRIGG